ncbi:MAG: NAD-dependent epimerase/dehydratase family protein [Xanthomonadaceae bacterium]|nr:NAD-dependent epimerase/dehydratase family protein [Xanthomonadaceae bacterium]
MSAWIDRDTRILVTGGAGFIGSHLANTLVERGYTVRALDSLKPQVHGADAQWPAYLRPEVERHDADIRDRDALRKALAGITHVYHFAAAVGVGQSMYEIEHYTDVNNRGTAILLEELIKQPVQRLIVASSMSVYGEGMYRVGNSIREPRPRSREQLSRAEWDLRDGAEVLEPMPTPETKHVAPSSVYALSKLDQEQLCLMFGAAYQVPTVALRFFNVYGPQQSLSNPYTGVLAIFAARILNGNAPLIFEDGLQQRDFVSVWDIAQACRLALTTKATGEVFNIGSGDSRTVLEIARSITEALNASAEAVVTGKYRIGDIRHCFADIDKARHLLGYEPRVKLEDGLLELAEWLSRTSATDNFLHAASELDRRGLTI